MKKILILLSIVLFLSSCFEKLQQQDNVDYVKQTKLEYNQNTPVGDIFEKYPFFNMTAWKKIKEGNTQIVEFQGSFDEDNFHNLIVRFDVNKERENNPVKIVYTGFYFANTLTSPEQTDTLSFITVKPLDKIIKKIYASQGDLFTTPKDFEEEKKAYEKKVAQAKKRKLKIEEKEFISDADRFYDLASQGQKLNMILKFIEMKEEINYEQNFLVLNRSLEISGMNAFVKLFKAGFGARLTQYQIYVLMKKAMNTGNGQLQNILFDMKSSTKVFSRYIRDLYPYIISGDNAKRLALVHGRLGNKFTQMVKNDKRNYYFELVAKNGYINCLRHYFEKDAAPSENSKNFKDAYITAIKNKRNDVVKMLLNLTRNPDMILGSFKKPFAQGKYQMSVLSYAVDTKNVPLVQYILTKNPGSTYKNLAFYQAVLNKDYDMAKLLVRNKADVDAHFIVSNGLPSSAKKYILNNYNNTSNWGRLVW